VRLAKATAILFIALILLFLYDRYHATHRSRGAATNNTLTHR
jgi:hypothetical protein